MPEIMRKRRFIAVALLAIALGVGSAPVGANAVADGDQPSVPAKQPGPPAATPGPHLNQRPMVEAARRIQAMAAARHPGGFAGIEFAHQRKGLVLYWHGTVPAEVSKLLNSLRSMAPTELRPAAFSAVALDREARRIIALDPTQTRQRVIEAGPLPDYGGLRIVVQGDIVQPGLRIPARVPIRVSAAQPATLATWRWNDTEPYYGGAAIRDFLGSHCSTAFAVVDNATLQSGMISASHCAMGATGNYQEVNWLIPNDTSRSYGRNTKGHRSTDSMIITGKSYYPRVYNGAWDSSYSHQVANWGYSAVNEYLCTDGAFSGEDCNNKVTSRAQYIQIWDPVPDEWWIIGPGFWIEQQAHVASVGNGDSGGPVYNIGTSTGVIAKGMIDAIANANVGPCRGVQYEGRKCAWRSFHVEISSILSNNAVSLLTY